MDPVTDDTCGGERRPWLQASVCLVAASRDEQRHASLFHFHRGSVIEKVRVTQGFGGSNPPRPAGLQPGPTILPVWQIKDV